MERDEQHEMAGTDITAEIEEKRKKMNAAADNRDFVAAGKLQEEIMVLELQRSMEAAGEQGDYVQAGKLQVQLNALLQGEIYPFLM